MDERLEEFHAQIDGYARRGLSALAIADRLAEHGRLVSFRQVRRYCREAGIALVDGEMPAATAAQRDLQQLARATDPGPRRPLPPPPFPPVVKRGEWPMDRVLVYFNEFALTISQALEGIFVLGATGSGKSSGSGKTIIHAVFWAEAGAVIFIVKAGEVVVYVRWAAECGRLQHVCVFEPGGKYRFNFFEYLTRHPSPGVSSEQNVTRVLEALAEISAGGSDRGGENAAFWTNNRRQVLSCAIRILARSGKPLSLPLLKTFIGEAPLEARDVQQGAYKRTAVFGLCLEAAVARSRGTPDEEPIREACDFFLKERAVRQPETTRASVAMDINSMIEAFIGNPMMRELFCTDTNLVPEHCLEGGLLIVNVPVTEYGTLGILANTIWKLLVQQALERRSDPPGDNRIPVAMITDEVHYLYTLADTLYTSTCRSVSCLTIGMTQSLPAFYARVPAHNAQHVVDGYLANFVTKVFHYNNDPTTLTYMAEQIGRTRRFRVSGSDKKKSLFSQLFGGGGSGGDDGLNVSSEQAFNVPPEKFSQLRTGGPENNYEVDAYVVLGPRAYRQIGQHYALVTFRQNGEDGADVVDDREISKSGTWWQRLKSGLRRLIGF